MYISEDEAKKLDWRDFGVFYCIACDTYFALKATRSGLFGCPICGADQEGIKTVHVGEFREDNDIDDDYGS